MWVTMGWMLALYRMVLLKASDSSPEQNIKLQCGCCFKDGKLNHQTVEIFWNYSCCVKWEYGKVFIFWGI